MCIRDSSPTIQPRTAADVRIMAHSRSVSGVVFNYIRHQNSVAKSVRPVSYTHLDVYKRQKELFPEKLILADTKIMDGGYHIAKTALEAGADIVTVCACTERATVADVIRAAHDFGKEALVDLIALDDYEAMADMMNELGADYVCAHMSTDTEGVNNQKEFFTRLDGAHFNAKLSIAGGIRLDNVKMCIRDRILTASNVVGP